MGFSFLMIWALKNIITKGIYVKFDRDDGYNYIYSF